MSAAYLAAGVALGVFLWSTLSFFLNLGGNLVDQAVRVIVIIKDQTAVLHNLSDTPVSDVHFHYGTSSNNELEIIGQNFAKPGEKVEAVLRPGQESPDSLVARYVGVRGLRWQRRGDGRVEIITDKRRGRAIRLMTWPWYNNELRSR